MADILKIKQYIIDNPENIENILGKAGFCKIKDRGKEYRCAKDEEGNGTSVSVNKFTLNSRAYSMGMGVKGDIITLLAEKLGFDMPRELPKVLNWMCKELGLEEDYLVEEKIDIRLPFGGYFREIKKSSYFNTDIVKTYNENILDEYAKNPNLRFLKDGISLETQEKFKIGYDCITERITVPWYSINGELLGIMGRLNKDIENDDISKWFPVIKFSKSNALYGFYENYQDILEKEVVFVGESEKFTLQLDSMGINVGVSLGGSDISEFKANCIKSLHPKKIITCYDEGLEEEFIYNETKKLKIQNIFYENEVGYIYDSENRYLTKGSKMSPTDLGKEVFERLIENCVVWL